MSDPDNPCLFCTPREVTARNALAYATRDSYPVSPGHTLIIPLRHCADFFELSQEEISASMDLIVAERNNLNAEFNPDGFNIGVNAGRAAGPSMFHVHIQLIPRYEGDHPNPQGGVRHVLPWKAHYKRKSTG